MLLAELTFAHFAFFIIGLGLVIWGAGIFVSGASRLAVLMKISPMLVAVTVVAFASSAPELFVSLKAALTPNLQNQDQAMGNIIGSNICNIALVVGLCAIINPFKMTKKFFSKEYIFFLVSALLLLVFVYDDYVLQRTEGFILFTLLIAFFVFCIRDAKKNPQTVDFIEEDILPDLEARPEGGYKKWVRPILSLAAGLLALVFGSRLVVENGQMLGGEEGLGFDDKLIGLFVLALGTSLPELAISVTAALKKEEDIALGNIVGSNIFNILCVGGLVSSIKPITVTESMVDYHLSAMLITSFLLLAFLRMGRSITRWQGTVFLCGYAYYAYAAVYLWRQ